MNVVLEATSKNLSEHLASLRSSKNVETIDMYLQVPQLAFLETTARYPAMVSAIGTGKTRWALTKMWKYCKENPNSLWIVVRKEFRDLQDSTMPDFEKYFGVKINSQRNHDLPNGSRIMFRHGEEVQGGADTPNVLKNLNLSGFIIEQAEEFATSNTFVFLRDRLRREAMPYHQGIVIANVAGHNWIYKMWKKKGVSNPAKYPLFEMTTFENGMNLPPEFIEDLQDMKKEAPAHYRRYVENDWDEEEGVDILISRRLIEQSYQIEGLATGGKGIVCDPARFGDCETALSIFQRMSKRLFAQVHSEEHKGWDTMQTVGRIMSIVESASEYMMEDEAPVDWILVDVNGLGGGVVDRLNEMKAAEESDEGKLLKNVSIIPYNSGEKAENNARYANCRAEDVWHLKELLESMELRLLEDETQTDQIATLQFSYKSNGQRYILSKDDMRRKGLPSPDRADRCIMAARHLVSLSPARNQKSPSQRKTEEFWKLVNADKARTSADEGGWHKVGFGEEDE